MDFWDDRGGADVLDRASEVEPPSGRERPGYGAALVVIVVLAALVGAGWWYAHQRADGRIPRGTTVAGVPIGGDSHADAVAALRAGLADRLATPITLQMGDRRVAVDPVAAGLQVDYRASVDRATVTRSWNPTPLWDYFTGGDDLQPVVTVDPTKLHAEVTSLAQQLGRPGRDAGVRFRDGRIEIIRAIDGQGFDVDQVSGALLQAYLADPSLAQAVLTPVAPAVGDQAVQTAIHDRVDPALAAPVTLSFAGRPLRLAPATFRDALTLQPHDGVLTLGVDRARLMQLVQPAVGRASTAVDATVRIVDGAPKVIAARRGTTFSPDAVARTFLSLLGRPAGRRRAPVPSVLSPASFSTSDARALQITQRVATFTTHYRRGQEDAAALARQAAAVDGTVLRPHGLFSLAGAEPGGGDLTQLATTLYDAAFYAGLRDVQHTPPVPHVARFPLGREATVRPGGPDLRFQDSTPYGVLVQVTSAPGALTVTLWSTRTWQVSATTTCARAAGSSAYEVETSRIFRQPGASTVDHVEKIYTNYPTLPAAVCRAAR